MFSASCDSGGILHRSCSLLMLFPGTFWTPLPLPELGGYRPDFSQPTPLYSLFWKLSPTSKQMAVLELCVCNPSHPPPSCSYAFKAVILLTHQLPAQNPSMICFLSPEFCKCVSFQGRTHGMKLTHLISQTRTLGSTSLWALLLFLLGLDLESVTVHAEPLFPGRNLIFSRSPDTFTGRLSLSLSLFSPHILQRPTPHISPVTSWPSTCLTPSSCPPSVPLLVTLSCKML